MSAVGSGCQHGLPCLYRPLLLDPYFGNFDSALIGPPEDNMQDFWNTWYSQNVLENRSWSILFHPSAIFPGSDLSHLPQLFLSKFNSHFYPPKYL